MKNWYQIFAIGLLLLFSILSITHSVKQKGEGREFSLSNQPSFDTSISLFRVKSGLKNYSHIKGFFIMSLFALVGFKKRKLFCSGLFVLALTLVTELLQGWSPTRHGRLTDVIPNVFGFLLAVISFSIITFLLEKRKNSRTKLSSIK
jgi:VanZ family protein